MQRVTVNADECSLLTNAAARASKRLDAAGANLVSYRPLEAPVVGDTSRRSNSNPTRRHAIAATRPRVAPAGEPWKPQRRPADQ